MLDAIRAIVASAGLLLWTFLSFGRCPQGWYLEGARAPVARCRPVPPIGCGEPRPPDDRPCPPDDRALPTLVYCTGGMTPIVRDERTVGCMRR